MFKILNGYEDIDYIFPGSITIVIIIDCNRLQLERNRNQIFQIVA